MVSRDMFDVKISWSPWRMKNNLEQRGFNERWRGRLCRIDFDIFQNHCGDKNSTDHSISLIICGSAELQIQRGSLIGVSVEDSNWILRCAVTSNLNHQGIWAYTPKCSWFDGDRAFITSTIRLMNTRIALTHTFFFQISCPNFIQFHCTHISLASFRCSYVVNCLKFLYQSFNHVYLSCIIKA